MQRKFLIKQPLMILNLKLRIGENKGYLPKPYTMLSMQEALP